MPVMSLLTQLGTADHLMAASGGFADALAPMVSLAAETSDGAGPWSLLPPVVAIMLAILTRRVVPSLVAGVFVGALIIARGNPLAATYHTIETHIWGSLADADHLRVIAFTMLMGAMVGVVTRAGGMHGLVNRLLPLARTRRGGQIVTWLLGLIIFFDDYANTLVLGQTMRPVTDRLHISRAKLAYLVDSTAAPIAGLAMVSTWVAVEIDYINEAMAAVGLGQEGLAVFIGSIPYRLYVLWALLMVLIVAWTGRDFGPMRRAEQRAMQSGPSRSADAQDVTSDPRLTLDEATPLRAINAIGPVAMVVLVFVAILVGSAATGDTRPTSFYQWLSAGDPYLALFYGALSGVVSAVVLAMGQRLLTWRQSLDAMLAGAGTMVTVLTVLVLAWALAGVVGADHLDAGGFLADLLATADPDSVAARLIQWGPAVVPATVFIIAAGMSFATGTSWGTMAILMPIAVNVAHAVAVADTNLTTSLTPDSPLLLATVGSVLAGAIFGDHCSPISDTTVLSSQASGCDHLIHVETQLPYACVVGGLSVLGLIAVGLGTPAWLVLLLGSAIMIVIVRVLGRTVDDDTRRGDVELKQRE